MAVEEPQPLSGNIDLEEDLQINGSGRGVIFPLFIFFILFFISLGFIYYLYVYKHHRIHEVGQTPRRLTVQIQSTLSSIGPRLGTVTCQGVINSLPVVSYGPGPINTSPSCKKEADCCICLASFEEEEKVKVIPRCCHAFHSECLDQWLVTRLSCPLCRGSIAS